MSDEPDTQAPEDMPPSYPPKKKQKLSRFLAELAFVIVTALVISVLIKTFLVQAFVIPSPSMTNTLEVGDRILVNKLANDEDDIHRGDVVVFVDPGNWLPEDTTPEPNAFVQGIQNFGEMIGVIPKNSGKHLVKRVIGVGGDHVTCCSTAGNLMVNGVEIEETYLHPGAPPSAVDFDVIVPTNHLWVMGDNRSNSEDSRAHMGGPGGGFVPVDNVEGRVWLIMYPFSRFGSLVDVDSVFADVPDNP